MAAALSAGGGDSAGVPQGSGAAPAPLHGAHAVAELFCGGTPTRAMIEALRRTAAEACAYMVLHVSGAGGGGGGGTSSSVVHITHAPRQTSTTGAQNRRMTMALCMPCRPRDGDLTPAQRGALKCILCDERNQRGRALLFVECALRSGVPLRYDAPLVLVNRRSAAHLYALWVALAVRAWPAAQRVRSPLGVNDALAWLLFGGDAPLAAAARRLLEALRAPAETSTLPPYVEPPVSRDALPHLTDASRAFLNGLRTPCSEGPCRRQAPAPSHATAASVRALSASVAARLSIETAHGRRRLHVQRSTV